MRSRIRPSATAPQPMKIADEYRFVTGGRPDRYMRRISATVWTTNVNVIRPQAAVLNGFVQPRQARNARMNPIRYSHLDLLNGSQLLNTTSRRALPASFGCSWSTFAR